MSVLSLIIKREFIAKVRNKSFIVMTFLGPLLIVGMSFLIAYLSSVNKGDIKTIGVHDRANVFVNDFKNTEDIKYVNLSNLSFDKAKDSSSNAFEGLIYVPEVQNVEELATKTTYISDDSPKMDFLMNLQKVIDTKLNKENLKKLGFDAEKIENAKIKSEVQFAKFSGEDGLKFLNEIKIGIGFAFGYLIMMFIIIYGNMVMRSVIEEKTNRIIEIIISSVKPFQLMMGKIIGTSLAGILQFLIWIVLGVVLMFSLSAVFGSQQEAVATAQVTAEQAEVAMSFMDKLQLYIAEIPVASILIGFVIFFIGGYFLYSSFYAAIGAAVDSETDSQQFLMPIIMPLMLAVYVGFLTVMNDPHGTVAVVFSLIPLTSPIVMLMRIPFGVPLWQLALSVVLLYGTFIFVVWFAAKIYRVGILMYGKKPSWKELYKWLKY
ncbi:ABC-2 type transport system permease protein [Flavobacterium aquaticum]|uniref:ABC-2 type transport system permease protein n=1 Tax=Flavobacterium aquaticum TaxID=1236486 RepID=A0A327YWR4_9FLAO|nr:ABC transporter permease [Flavobacterium aquaticum]RAK25111.1 ABC-2 type transport system permease protein [Flavobacterium aquaticum]